MWEVGSYVFHHQSCHYDLGIVFFSSFLFHISFGAWCSMCCSYLVIIVLLLMCCVHRGFIATWCCVARPNAYHVVVAT